MDEELARMLSERFTRENGVPTSVEVKDGFAFVHVEGADHVERFALPPGTYERLAVSEMMDVVLRSHGFGTTLR